MDTKPYQTFWRRVGANLIDALVLGPMTLISVVLLYRGLSYWAYTVLLLFSLAVAGAYQITMLAAYGQTLGKMATGVRVIRLDGSRLDARAAGTRFLVYTFGALLVNAVTLVFWYGQDEVNLHMSRGAANVINAVNLLWLLAQILVFANNGRRRAIHDYVADTQVVIVSEWETAAGSVPAA